MRHDVTISQNEKNSAVENCKNCEVYSLETIQGVRQSI